MFQLQPKACPLFPTIGLFTGKGNLQLNVNPGPWWEFWLY